MQPFASGSWPIEARRGQEIPFFQILIGEQYDAECERGAAMPKIRPKTAKKMKHAAIAAFPAGRPSLVRNSQAAAARFS